MSDVQFGDFFVHAITSSNKEIVVTVVSVAEMEATRGFPKGGFVYVTISNSEAPWWKDRLGRRIRLVAQDL